MRLLADENVPRSLVVALRASGCDVLWVREATPGSMDEHVLETAVQDLRVLVTLDKDFGELAFRKRLPAGSGIILVRIEGTPGPGPLTDRVLEALRLRDDWTGRFAVIEADRVRVRPLPATSAE